MQRSTGFASRIILATAIGALAFSNAAWADGKGRGRHGDDDDRRGPPHRQHEPRGGDTNIQINFNFGDADRRVVRDYYEAPRYAVHCPPGLAKKGNGCMPPGHAKRWVVGHPLPPDVIFYEVPRDLIVLLPPPPPRHRYVRVDSDILMIAIGTGMVLDGIQNLGRM
ncbi:RcnB family protein [Ferrovibrio sp.]|uniref:RcnB family protein n=1 Tax=Ferrovibrio sp. TaxID=1917215 RepID=UPI003D0F0F2C